MLPDFSNRLSNLIKSMEKTIIPAIDPESGLAKEQAALVIGHLTMLNQQWDGLYLYECRSFDNMLALAAHLAVNARGGPETTQAAKLLSGLIEELPDVLPLTARGVNSQTIELGKQVDELIHASFRDGSSAFKALLSETILNYAGKQSARERVWFRANKLDPDPSDLASMEDMLHSDIYKFSPA